MRMINTPGRLNELGNPYADIGIVGGGPIGCWTAMQIKQRAPETSIVIYERKQEYERDHILSIDRASLLQWSKMCPNSAAFLRAVFEAQSTYSIASGLHETGQKPEIKLDHLPNNRLWYWMNLPKVVDIRTIDFERILKAECEKAGVSFVYRKVETPGEIMALHPECDTFIAADGANSKMREAIWGPKAECLWQRNIFPSLDFKYASEGQARYLRINTYDKLGHVYAENIGIAKDGISDINLRFIVSKEEYDAIGKATFKEPIIVTPDSPFWGKLGLSAIYNRTFKEDFYDLQALRAKHAHENQTGGKVTMTKIYLSQYFAKKFAKTVEHEGKQKKWYLVGDAAMGMPFYRAINSGLILGAQLAYLLTSKTIAENFRPAVYNFYTQPCRIAREFARVAKTEARIHFYKDFARPILHHIAQTKLEPLVRAPLDYALKHLKYGKTS
jgi:hypothetical protein